MHASPRLAASPRPAACRSDASALRLVGPASRMADPPTARVASLLAIVADLPRATVRSVVHEAAEIVVSDHRHRHPLDAPVAYVGSPHPSICPQVQCFALGPVLSLGLEARGHLHRSGGPGNPHTEDSAVGLIEVGLLIAAEVVRDLLDIRLAQAEHELRHVRIATETNRVVGVAIGVLMASRHCSGAEAFAMVEQASQDSHLTIREVAHHVQDTGTVPDVGVGV